MRCDSMRLRLRWISTITLSLALAAAVDAQQPASPDLGQPVTVRVVDESTLQSLPNAEVAVLASGRRFLTNSLGEIRLSRPAGGPFVIQVRQIGFRPVSRDLAAASGTVVVRLARVAYELPRVVTTADPGCADLPDQASAELSARALEQLRASAERYEFFRREYPFELEIGRRSAQSAGGRTPERVVESIAMSNSEVWREPYRPGRVLLREPGRIGFKVPILFLATLADSTFWAHHCFSARGVELRDGRPVIRLEFAPTSRVRAPDWAGVALLDSATSELRRIEFHMTGLQWGSRPRRFEGYTTFAAPSPFIVVPDTTLAVWWRGEPNRRGEWGPADVGQMLYIRKLTWRRGEPPQMLRDQTP